MINIFKESRREFISTVLGNICVLLLSAAVISESFIKFNFAIKAIIVSAGFAVFALGILVCPDKDKEGK